MNTMADIQEQLRELDKVATKYMADHNHAAQANTLNEALQLAGLSSIVGTFNPDLTTVFIKDAAITVEQIIDRTDIPYWVVIIPQESYLRDLLRTMSNVIPTPRYQVGYHMEDGTNHIVREVDSIMAVIDTVRRGYPIL
jgi:hypothetical protein